MQGPATGWHFPPGLGSCRPGHVRPSTRQGTDLLRCCEQLCPPLRLRLDGRQVDNIYYSNCLFQTTSCFKIYRYIGSSTTGNSFSSVCDYFFYAFLAIRTEKLKLFCAFQIIPSDKYNNTQKNDMFFLCVAIYTRKNFTLTEKFQLFCRWSRYAQKNYVHAQ